MTVKRSLLPIAFMLLAVGIVSPVANALAAPDAAKPADLDGTWEIAIDKAPGTCRLVLRAQPSDKGDYFLGMSPACRHSMPALAKIGRWTMPDATHLTLNEPTGTLVMKLAATADGFAANLDKRDYRLRRISESGRSAVGGPAAPTAVGGPAAPTAPGEKAAAIVPIVKRAKVANEPPEKPGDLAGRYAVMREKRDTGCMLTLDLARAKGGTRAQLAPGCRDQGIVIFDPSSWQIVKGELVLTARAGHKAHLLKNGEGAWQKDPKDGGKPLGLKRL